MKYKWIFKYGLIFVLSLIFLNFIPFDLDEIWNYGFMHNIYSGLVPYKDFNMVITPFFPMLFSLPFFIFGSNLSPFKKVPFTEFKSVIKTSLFCFSYKASHPFLKWLWAAFCDSPREMEFNSRVSAFRYSL